MRYLFNETTEVKENEVAMLFIDFTGRQQLVICTTDEQLPLCLVKPGTTPVISL